jgi:hypothetical protein
VSMARSGREGRSEVRLEVQLSCMLDHQIAD